MSRTLQRIKSFLDEQYEPVTAAEVRKNLNYESRAWVCTALRELECLGKAQAVGRNGQSNLWVSM